MALCIHFVALMALAFAFCGCSDPPPNILLVTLDTTRADRLGTYGHEAQTSPRIDELAQHANVYERAYSTSSWTLPAHASLFTGEFPASHGAHLDPQGPLNMGDGITGPAHLAELRVQGLAEAKRTLAEDLRDAGYATAGIVSGPWLMRVFGLAQGFEHWDDSAVSRHGANARTVSDRALAWLDSEPREPFLLFLNYFDPHEPYKAPPEFARRFPSAPYEAEIAYADYELGRVFDRLREQGLWDRTNVIVTADHGQLFGEHGIKGHNRYLFEPLIRIPLIVKPAGSPVAPTRVTRPIQIIDVSRLILEAAGLDEPAHAEQPIYAEVYPLEVQKHRGQWRALFDGDLKFLWNSRGAHRLHDVVADPDEMTNLTSIDPERAASMERALERFRASLPLPPPGDPGIVDSETRGALEALGYLE